MMLDAVMSDMGCTHPPTFVLPDISGLAPLVLPESLLRGQDGGHAMPSPDSVRRFDTAMNAESPSFTRHVAAVMHMVAGDIVTHVSPNETEARQAVESAERPEVPAAVETPVAVPAGPCRDTDTQGISMPSDEMQEPPVDSVVTSMTWSQSGMITRQAVPKIAISSYSAWSDR